MIAKDPALAELVRIEQDHGKQINALLGTLNNTLSMPAAERDEANIRAINATLVQLRADRKKARDDINRRFPAYADLVDPKPPTVDQIAAALRPDEAFSLLFRSRSKFRLGRSENRTGCICGGACHCDRSRSQGPAAA